jgi:mono/diheme cytochrome c family protein
VAIYENLYSMEVIIMKKLLYVAVCLAFLGFLTSCGGGDEEAEPDKAPTEEQTTDEQAPTTETDAGVAEIKYQQSCSSCHGGDLVSGGAPDLNAIGTKYSKDDILGIIKNGKGNMPGGLLTGEDADAVASWLAEKK